MVVRFDEPIFPYLPDGWQTANDYTESFLLAAALELEARSRINPANPISGVALYELAPEYRHDPFASFAGVFPRTARLPLLQLVWMYIDEALGSHLPRPTQWGLSDRTAALAEVEGAVLGAHGTTLFIAAFDRIWGEWDVVLSPIEEAFVAGDSIPGIPKGSLAADGFMYMESVWCVAFRLIERRGTRHFIESLADRHVAVEDILRRGAQRGEAGESRLSGRLWPGFTPETDGVWPFVAHRS